MMDGAMGSMMAWMMGIGLLGWVLVAALLVTLIIVLVQWLARPKENGRLPRGGASTGRRRLP